MAITGAAHSVAFLAGRALFAAVVGYLALGNLLDREASVGYAKSKGVPLAGIAVPLGSLGLVAGALAVLLGVYPGVGAAGIVAVLLPITLTMHDFWTLSGQDRQNEQIHFLKNIGLVGAALLFLSLAVSSWPYALGIRL
jgi:uncharacterized membrane protein YphA (DoxX/SURF4 family)